MKTKNMLILTLIICYSIFWTSCAFDDKRLVNLEKSFKLLQDSLYIVNKQFIQPFDTFQDIVMSEFDNSPEVSIKKYEILIDEYEKSYWAHESKKRIKNIKDRRQYWSPEKGWNLPKKADDTELVVINSCPGC